MINEDETRQLAGEHNLFRAAKLVFKMGPKTMIIKRGENGAIMVHKDFVFSVPAYPLEEVFDPTGAGDTFAGGFMGYIAARARSTRRRCVRPWCMARCWPASRSERFGVERLAKVKRSEITTAHLSPS